jgi:hypothetical protein
MMGKFIFFERGAQALPESFLSWSVWLFSVATCKIRPYGNLSSAFGETERVGMISYKSYIFGKY